MACGYGACYGCAVEIDGEWKRLCVEGPSLLTCCRLTLIQRLRLPRRADRTRGRAADSTPSSPRRSRRCRAPATRPSRIVETDGGDAQLDRPRRTRARERFLADTLPRLRELGAAALDLGRGLLGREYAETCERLDGVDDRAQPLLPERRRGARVGRRDRRRLPRGDGAPAVREALAGRLGRRRGRPRGRGGGCGRPLARQHDARPRPRPRSLQPVLGPATGGYSGPALKPIALAAVFACRARDRRYRSSGWAASQRVGTRSSSSPRAHRAVALGTILFADPDAPERIRAELDDELERLGLRLARTPFGASPTVGRASAASFASAVLQNSSTEACAI